MVSAFVVVVVVVDLVLVDVVRDGVGGDGGDFLHCSSWCALLEVCFDVPAVLAGVVVVVQSWQPRPKREDCCRIAPRYH